jgi:hypothetical protein
MGNRLRSPCAGASLGITLDDLTPDMIRELKMSAPPPGCAVALDMLRADETSTRDDVWDMVARAEREHSHCVAMSAYDSSIGGATSAATTLVRMRCAS